MAKLKYTDNAASLLTTTINNSDDPVTFSITASDGAKFPSLTAGEWYPIVVIKANQQLEKMKVTARSGDSMTAVRAQGGTTKLAFSIGDAVYMGPTKEFIDELLFKEDALAGKPWYCGVAGGTANAIALSAAPTITAYADGMEVTFVALTDNTSTSVVVNIDGVGNVSLKDSNGNALAVGAIKAGGNYRIQRNSTANDFRVVSGFVPTAVPGAFSVGGVLSVLGGIDVIPKNTKLSFINNAAPTGWVFDAALSDKVLRCPPAATDGGVTGGTWTVAGLTASAHSHTQQGTFFVPADSGSVDRVGTGAFQVSRVDHNHTVTISGQTSNANTNGIASDASWRPAYVNAIPCYFNRGP